MALTTIDFLDAIEQLSISLHKRNVDLLVFHAAKCALDKDM
jgi:hypothetical protein